MSATMPYRSAVRPGRDGFLSVLRAELAKFSSVRATYAAVLATRGNGVRMQHDFVNDTAGGSEGVSPSAPRWLRLTRTGSTVTTSESTDGTTWSPVGLAVLPALPATAEVGLFATSPPRETVRHDFGGRMVDSSPTSVRAVFDNVTVEGASAGGAWTPSPVGPNDGAGLAREGDALVVTGSGDIAPVPIGGGPTLEAIVPSGTAVGLIVVTIVATLFITAEYRSGLIRTTFTASPRRGRVLAAKALVVGGLTFVVALAGLAVVVP
jgi:hypothetical protein